MKYFYLLLCLLSPVLAHCAPSTATADISQRETVYRAELKKIVDGYNAKVAAMAGDYILELRKISARMKTSGDQAGAAAVKAEAERYLKALKEEPDPFEAVPELTEDALVAKPEGLRLAQDNYVGERTASEVRRNESIVSLAKKYCDALARLQQQYSAAERDADAAAAKKALIKLQVAMQGKDFPVRTMKEAGLTYMAQPPTPDLANLKERAAQPTPAVKSPNAATLLTSLPASVQAFLIKPMEYDKEWPPEVTKWRFEGQGSYAHDFSLYNQPGMPAELGMYVHKDTMRAYVQGTVQSSTHPFQGKNLQWVGRAMAWRLNDSRDLVCRVVFRTRHPAPNASSGPAACVAVYSVNEQNRLIASMTTPMVNGETTLFMAKHYSYNRLNIKWEGTKNKRGFTIPDHTPLRVAVGVVGGSEAGQEIDATIEILPSGHLEDN